MKRNIKIAICLGGALILTLVAVILIYNFLSPARTTVYVFNSGYKAGTEIQSNMLTPMQVDASMIVAGNKTSMSGYFVTADNFTSVVHAGDTLRSDVGAGKPFMLVDIAEYGTNEIEVRLTETGVGVTISVNNITGITSSLKAESHVNVYSAQKNGLTQLILENIRVISVAAGQNGITSVTLDLNNTQAIAVISAQQVGTIYLGLVNASGYQYMTAEELYPDEGLPPEASDLFPEPIIETVPHENATEETPVVSTEMPQQTGEGGENN